jgi:predicted RNA-binding Zn ribbon-like protein
MATWTEASFLGGHLALDFVNTVGDHTKDRDVECLREFVDAVDWAHAADILDNNEREYLLARAEREPTEATEVLAELRVQREALHAFLLTGIENTACPPAVRKRVEADITSAYLEAELSDQFRIQKAWVVDTAKMGPRVLARRLALASAELLASDQRSQIGACGRCSWLFLDPSPTHRRRWCSMTTCGNRAKAERHRRR